MSTARQQRAQSDFAALIEAAKTTCARVGAKFIGVSRRTRRGYCVKAKLADRSVVDVYGSSHAELIRHLEEAAADTPLERRLDGIRIVEIILDARFTGEKTRAKLAQVIADARVEARREGW